MKIINIILITLWLASPLLAEDLKTKQGILFSDVEVITNKIDSTGFYIKHSRGITKLKYEYLTEEDLKKYGFTTDSVKIEIANNRSSNKRSTKQDIEADINQVLGRSNVTDGERAIFAWSTDGKSVVVGISINDNLTRSFIKVGFFADSWKVIQRLHDYNNFKGDITTTGVFPFADKYGKSRFIEVGIVTLSASDYSKIDKANFTSQQLENFGTWNWPVE